MARIDRLPRAAIVDTQTGRPTQAFTVYWQRVLEAQEATDAAQDVLIGDLADLLADIILLNELITEAEEIIEQATTGSELTNSYVDGLTLTATDAGASATITISGHNRVYPKTDGTGTPVAVTGGSLSGLAYSTQYWIYYDQPSRAGGAVTYFASTSPTAQIGDRHNVGAVTTPAAAGAPIPGNVIRPPGYVEP